MTETAAMIAAARACLGTPFHHQGRLPGVGLDCIGLVIVALRAAGLEVRDRLDYARWPEGTALQTALLSHDARRVAAMRPGDILLFAFAGVAQHAALCTAPGQLIHAYAPSGQVVETRLNPVWQRRLVDIFRFGSE